jgi:hypothetical protein
MNDIERAIEILKNEIKTSFSILDALPEKSRDRATDLTNKIKAYGLAIEALKKQNSIKPFQHQGHCGKCICEKILGSVHINYCPECGQKLDWSEVENE